MLLPVLVSRSMILSLWHHSILLSFCYNPCVTISMIASLTSIWQNEDISVIIAASGWHVGDVSIGRVQVHFCPHYNFAALNYTASLCLHEFIFTIVTYATNDTINSPIGEQNMLYLIPHVVRSNVFSCLYYFLTANHLGVNRQWIYRQKRGVRAYLHISYGCFLVFCLTFYFLCKIL